MSGMSGRPEASPSTARHEEVLDARFERDVTDMSRAVLAAPATTVATGHAFGTFGELLQGVLPDGDVDFLVTLPLARWARARFRFETGRPLRVFPADRRKSLRLARTLFAAAGCPDGGTLVLDSDLAVGKGLASSSADLVATARAVGTVLGLDVSPPAIERCIRGIEPTDGVMYDGIVAFEHRRVRLRRFLGALPAMTVVALDEGGQVDTVAFNRRPKPFTGAEKREYARLLDELDRAVRARDLPAVGAVTTRSAQLNQRLQPKATLEQLTSIACRSGALGVTTTHSGSMIGVLVDERDPDYPDRLAAVQRACARTGAAVSVLHSLPFPGGVPAAAGRVG